MVTWYIFHEVFQKSEILKNAVSGRCCADSNLHASVNSLFIIGHVSFEEGLLYIVPSNTVSFSIIQSHQDASL